MLYTVVVVVHETSIEKMRGHQSVYFSYCLLLLHYYIQSVVVALTQESSRRWCLDLYEYIMHVHDLVCVRSQGGVWLMPFVHSCKHTSQHAVDRTRCMLVQQITSNTAMRFCVKPLVVHTRTRKTSKSITKNKTCFPPNPTQITIYLLRSSTYSRL